MYEWLDSPAAPVSDVVTDNAVAEFPPPFGMVSNARLLNVGSRVVDGNRLNDGRVLPSPPSDSEEVDEARISTTEEEGRRCRTGGMGGFEESLALLW